MTRITPHVETVTHPETGETLTRVRHLTGANTSALVQANIIDATILRTVADIPGEPADALASVQAAMDKVRVAEGGRAFGYSSLIAVRNKLRAAVAS